jgi:heme/copper-type cytochrome/quinol oxidase subunit 3
LIRNRILKFMPSITTSRWLPDMARHTELYFSLYFLMTGMHALHMIIGIGILGFMILRARAGAYTTGHVTFVRTSGCTGTLSTLSGFISSRCCI